MLVGTRMRSLGRFVVKAMIFGLAFTLSLFGPVSVRAVEADGLGTVSGTVKNTDGNPVVGVAVGIYARSSSFVQTNSNGAYTLQNVPISSGAYDVQLLAPCSRDQSKRVVVDGTETVNFTIAVQDKQAGYTCGPSSFPYINGTTTLALSGDDGTQSVSLPFAFPFFGASYTSAFVVTNGFLAFSDPGFPWQSTQPLPTSNQPNAGIYPFFDDLDIDASAAIRTASGGVAPNRFFVVEWLNATFFEDPNLRVSAEAILFENGRIVFQYAGITANNLDDRERGAFATVGLENQAGTAAFQRSWHQPVLDNSLGIEFAPAPK